MARTGRPVENAERDRDWTEMAEAIMKHWDGKKLFGKRASLLRIAEAIADGDSLNTTYPGDGKKVRGMRPKFVEMLKREGMRPRAISTARVLNILKEKMKKK